MAFPLISVAYSGFFGAMAYVISWAITGGLTRFLTGAGISLVVFTVLNTLLEEGLQRLVTSFGLLGSAAQLIYMAGVSEAISIIGSTATAVIAIRAASISFTSNKYRLSA